MSDVNAIAEIHHSERIDTKSTGCQPILRWAGSKRKIMSKLREYWSGNCTRYVEPFAGSCSLFFEVRPTSALLADKNRELIEFYEVLRSYPKKLYEEVLKYKVNKETYYKVRSIDPLKLRRLKRASRFIYLNRYCFNGIYRTNLKGEFNVPYAASGTGGIPPLKRFVESARLLKTVDLRAWDFGVTLRYVREGDFVYLDPPYAVKNRRVFREYGPTCFGANDLLRLSLHLDKIHKRGAIFLLSYADCKEIRQIGKKWKIQRIKVQRNIAGFASERRNAYEVLVTNR